MKKMLFSCALLAVAAAAMAKLPPPDEATKAKAAETAAKAAWQAKVDAYQLCKAQDRVAASYGKGAGKLVPVAAKSASAPVAAKPAASAVAAAPQPAASGTPVAAVPIPPCADPGPFAYAPPEQKPLEASGAHSPAPTAASPPSGKEPAAALAPAKK
jgi:hypothetical protein